MSETPENINIKNEQHYIELTNQLKEKYEVYEIENNIYKTQNHEMKKDLMVIYGLIRTIDMFYSNYIINFTEDDKLQFLIEEVRSLCSAFIDANILA